jgi:hypothetical protein
LLNHFAQGKYKKTVNIRKKLYLCTVKNFVAILFLAIIGLSVSTPLWERQEDDMHQICQSNSDCDKDCCSDCCSPFYICGTCHGFEPVSQTIDVTVQAMLTSLATPYSQQHFSTFYGDIWQPPKIA